MPEMVVGRGRACFRDIGLAIPWRGSMLTLSGEIALENLCLHF